MVNFIQLIGDSFHLLSFVIIIYKIFKDKSCQGVSAKTFEIYLLVFCTRYLDLFMYYISFYNTFMKILFIAASAFILYLMHCKQPYKNTYLRKKEDVFPHIYLIVFAIIMTLILNKNYTLWGLIWSFSLWLESVAVFPQISIIAKTNGFFSYTAHYLAALGSYRFFYILLWIYRYLKQGRLLWVSVLSGILQVLLYVDFFYPLADQSTFDGYMAEIPEGKMSPELLELRKQIWKLLRPFRMKLCKLEPSRFIHFGSTADVEELMSNGIDEYAYLGWKRQIQSNLDSAQVAAYNSYGRGSFGKHVYLEDCIVKSGKVGEGTILSGLELNGEIIPPDVVMHCLKLVDGKYVTRVYGILDNPKGEDIRLFNEKLDIGDVWVNEEHNLWNAKIYPACDTMQESIAAALNLYDIVHGQGDRDAWGKMPKESLFSSFCKADGAQIQAWQKKVKEMVETM